MNLGAMKTNGVESRATDGSFIEPAHCAVASEDLSRFEGEGGPEAPVPALALIEGDRPNDRFPT